MELTVDEKLAADETSKLPGWGVDANRENNPAYPMKKRTDGEHAVAWERPTLQESEVEVLQSNERPSLSAVYGTSTPPSGLSGMIRRAAFKYSESSYGHWLPLMLADRINVVEGLVADVAQGRIPNIFAELGWRAEWKYNRKGLLLRLAFRVAVVGAAILLVKKRRARRSRNVLRLR